MSANEPYPERAIDSIPWPEVVPEAAPAWPLGDDKLRAIGAEEPQEFQSSFPPLQPLDQAPIQWPSPVPQTTTETSGWPESSAATISPGPPPAWGGGLSVESEGYAHDGWRPPETLAPQPYTGGNAGAESLWASGFPEGMPATEYSPHGAPKELTTYDPFG